MKVNRRFTHVGAALFVLVASLGLSTRALAEAEDEGENNRGTGRLVGTWEVSVTPPNGIPNPSLVTFNSDHTMTETSRQDEHVPVSSPGHGVWDHIQGNKFAFTFKFFIVDPTGNLVCTAKIRSTVKLNRTADQWSGPARIDCTAPNGNHLFGFDLTSVATRMHLEFLEH